MSQYPYNPDPLAYPAATPRDPRALRGPARWAGLTMIILGGLALVIGLLMFAIRAFPFDQIPEETRRQLQQIEIQAGVSLKTILTIYAFFFWFIGLFLLIPGVFARGGRPGGVITALVIVGLLTLLGAFMSVASLFTSGVGACFPILGEAALIMTLVWLIQATRNLKLLKAFEGQLPSNMGFQMPQPPSYPTSSFPGGIPSPPPGSNQRPPDQGNPL